MQNEKPARLGRRPKPDAEKTICRSVTMPASDWAHAERLGEGNASAGVRRALKAARIKGVGGR